MEKLQDLVNTITANVKAQLEEEAEKKNNVLVKVFACIGLILVAALIAYAVYRFLQPKDYDDYDDDVYDDDYDDEKEEGPAAAEAGE